MKKLFELLKRMHREAFDDISKAVFFGFGYMGLVAVFFAEANPVSIAVFFFGCLAMHPIFSFSIEELVKWVLERRDSGFTKWTVQFTDGSKTVLHLPKAEMTTDQTLALIKAQLKGQL